MYFYEYMDKEIPNWMNSLKSEYIEKIKEAFMDYYTRSKEIEIIKSINEKNPSEKFTEDIKKREKTLEKSKMNLKIVTEYAKQHGKKEKTIYEHAKEAIERIKEFRQNYDDITTLVDEDYRRLEEEKQGKSL